MRGLHPRQLHVFDDPNRDDRGWVLSVAHVEVVQAERLASRNAETTRLVPVDAPGGCPTTTPSIIAGAVEHIRSRYADKPDPDRLLGDEFTLRELRLAHEQIAGRPLQRDTFRRTMEPQLVATGRTTTGHKRTASRAVPAPRRRRIAALTYSLRRGFDGRCPESASAHTATARRNSPIGCRRSPISSPHAAPQPRHSHAGKVMP